MAKDENKTAIKYMKAQCKTCSKGRKCELYRNEKVFVDRFNSLDSYGMPSCHTCPYFHHKAMGAKR